MKKTILFIAMFLMGAGTTLQARNYYVSLGASGTGTSASPYGTIAEAAARVMPGDTVFIAGGVYGEREIKPKESGSEAGGSIVFCPWPETGRVILTKEDNVEGDDMTGVFNFSGLSYIWLEGITFRDMAYLKSCVDLSGARHCVVTGCQFLNLGIEEVAADWAGVAMIWMNGTQDCVVSNCYFKEVFGDGVNFFGQETNSNLVCHNVFVDLKGKKRSWETTGLYKYSSAITGTDNSFGDNLICFNHITGGQDGIWLDRDASRNLVVRNFGNGGQRLVFNESRCAGNWYQENVALNMSESGYRSALYGGTNWSFDTRYVNNVACHCQNGIYLHKSKHNEVRNNIVFASAGYNLVLTDSASYYGQNFFRNNLWHSPSKVNSIEYHGKAVSPRYFAQQVDETDGIYNQSPGFVALGDAPADYLLKETSVCAGAGDGGIDMGAYPVYHFYDMGCDTARQDGPVRPYVEKLVTEALRGEEYDIRVRLPKTFADTIRVRLVPVAGDACPETDYELQDTLLTFLPGEKDKVAAIRFVGEELDFGKLLVLRLCGEESTPYVGRTYAAFKLITKEEHDALLHTDIYLEAEDAQVGALWNILDDSEASGGRYVMVKPGNNCKDSAPDGAEGWVSVSFDITRPTTYVLWMRTICPTPDDDSFWVRLDNEEWSEWNGVPNSSVWQWNKCPRTFTMLEGRHTLHVGYREDGSKLDKLLLTCQGTIPEGMGTDVTPVVIPSADCPEDVVDIQYYDLAGRRLDREPSRGIFMMRVCLKDGRVETRKIMR